MKDQHKQFLEAIREADELDLQEQLGFIQEKTAALLEANIAEDEALKAQLAEFKAAADEAELLGNEERRSRMQEEALAIQDQMRVNEEERVAIMQDSADRQEKIDRDLADAKKKIQDDLVNSMSGMFGALASLTALAGEDNRDAAIAQKALSIAQATINTYLAATAAFANTGGGIPGTIAMAASIIAGIATVAKISSTPIPSAETGGSFIADYSSPRVDAGLLRVNKGEQVDVTPAGQAGQGEMSGGESGGLVAFKDYFWELVNEGVSRGAIYAMPGGNL
jgi:hypothetical protein